MDEIYDDMARAKWESSGLTGEHAKKLKLKGLDPDQTAGLGETFHRAASLLLTYFDLKGKPTDFFRVRYLEPLPGFAGAVEKPQRYAQPPRTLNEAYFPPLLDRPWDEIAADPTVVVYITEGELKAAAGCSAGLATLGLGGVDMFKATKRQIALLPALAKFEWSNRQVVICYDSDAAENTGVVRAERALAQELLARGSHVHVASIPKAKDGGKQGLDDFLVAHGAKGLEKILADAPAFAESDALWSLNDEVFYVRSPGVVVEQATGQRFQPTRFVMDAYANRHYLETIFDKDGNQKYRKKGLAKHWIEWESRFELERMTYAPGQSRIFDSIYNTWPGWGCEPKRGDVAPWKWLLTFIFKSDPTYQNWFEQWCAYPIQHPGEKMFTSTLVWGIEKGTGKSFIPYALGGIYGKNFIEVKSKSFKTGFNSWAKDRQFVYGDEISGTEARIDADWLKGLITQPNVTINEKYLPEYTVPDQMNYYFSSNHPDALFVEDKDRRYFVHEVVGPPAERALYERVHQWLHGDGPMGSYQGKGAAALFWHLLHLDLRGFNPRAEAPGTLAKERMILAGKSDVALWVGQLRESTEMALRPLLNPRAVKEAELIEVSQLLRAYDPESRGKVTATGMGRALSSAGFRQVNEGIPVRTKKGLLRLYVIRNPEKWLKAKPNEAKEHWEKYFGSDSIK